MTKAERTLRQAKTDALVDMLLQLSPRLSNRSIVSLVNGIDAVMRADELTIEFKCRLFRELVSSVLKARPHPRWVRHPAC
jgi:hypothetical protein